MLGKKRDTPYRVEALGKQHDKEGFTCGSGPLDHYLAVQAGQDTRMRVAATFVLCEGERNRVIGFYTLSAISVILASGRKMWRRNFLGIRSSRPQSSGAWPSTGSFGGGGPESIS